jgi:hypothetical protein
MYQPFIGTVLIPASAETIEPRRFKIILPIINDFGGNGTYF